LSEGLAPVCDLSYAALQPSAALAPRVQRRQYRPQTTDASQTLTLPKPLVEFANKPMIQHQVEALAAAGVTNIVLAVNYRPEIMTKALKEVSRSGKGNAATR
jgi:hypothetical protein